MTVVKFITSWGGGEYLLFGKSHSFYGLLKSCMVVAKLELQVFDVKADKVRTKNF